MYYNGSQNDNMNNQGYAPQGYAPQGYAPQGYAPQNMVLNPFVVGVGVRLCIIGYGVLLINVICL